MEIPTAVLDPSALSSVTYYSQLIQVLVLYLLNIFVAHRIFTELSCIVFTLSTFVFCHIFLRIAIVVLPKRGSNSEYPLADHPPSTSSSPRPQTPSSESAPSSQDEGASISPASSLTLKDDPSPSFIGLSDKEGEEPSQEWEDSAFQSKYAFGLNCGGEQQIELCDNFEDSVGFQTSCDIDTESNYSDFENVEKSKNFENYIDCANNLFDVQQIDEIETVQSISNFPDESSNNEAADKNYTFTDDNTITPTSSYLFDVNHKVTSSDCTLKDSIVSQEIPEVHSTKSITYGNPALINSGVRSKTCKLKNESVRTTNRFDDKSSDQAEEIFRKESSVDCSVENTDYYVSGFVDSGNICPNLHNYENDFIEQTRSNTKYVQLCKCGVPGNVIFPVNGFPAKSTHIGINPSEKHTACKIECSNVGNTDDLHIDENPDNSSDTAKEVITHSFEVRQQTGVLNLRTSRHFESRPNCRPSEKKSVQRSHKPWYDDQFHWSRYSRRNESRSSSIERDRPVSFQFSNSYSGNRYESHPFNARNDQRRSRSSEGRYEKRFNSDRSHPYNDYFIPFQNPNEKIYHQQNSRFLLPFHRRFPSRRFHPLERSNLFAIERNQRFANRFPNEHYHAGNNSHPTWYAHDRPARYNRMPLAHDEDQAKLFHLNRFSDENASNMGYNNYSQLNSAHTSTLNNKKPEGVERSSFDVEHNLFPRYKGNLKNNTDYRHSKSTDDFRATRLPNATDSGSCEDSSHADGTDSSSYRIQDEEDSSYPSRPGQHRSRPRDHHPPRRIPGRRVCSSVEPPAPLSFLMGGCGGTHCCQHQVALHQHTSAYLCTAFSPACFVIQKVCVFIIFYKSHDNYLSFI